MIFLVLCYALFADFGQASNVIPHIPNRSKSPQLQTPLTLREPIQTGTVVWILGSFQKNVYNNDLKIYVIAGGNGEYNDKMKAAVLEIRAYHDQDRISYGSLKHYGGDWNYAAESKNPLHEVAEKHYDIDIVLEFKDKFIVVWVQGMQLSIYSYSATIDNLSEISGIYIPQNDELAIIKPQYLSSTPFGSFPYQAQFDPPLSKGTQVMLMYGVMHCGAKGNDVNFVFGDSPETFHIGLGYFCEEETFVIGSEIDGEKYGHREKKFLRSSIANGMVLMITVDPVSVKVSIKDNVDSADLFDFPHQIDIEKRPITNLFITASKSRFSMSILAIID